MGVPEDTRETLQETYDLIKEIDIDKPMVVNICPFPGTSLFNQVVRDNLLIDKIDLEKCENFRINEDEFLDNL